MYLNFLFVANLLIYFFSILVSDSKGALPHPVDVFALFNATEILGALNYTQLGSQLDRDGFLPAKVLTSRLPLRSLHPASLVLRLPSLEVLFQLRNALANAWISPRALHTLRPGELLFFEVFFCAYVNCLFCEWIR